MITIRKNLSALVLSTSIMAALLAVPTLDSGVMLHPAFLAALAAGGFFLLLLNERLRAASLGPEGRSRSAYRERVLLSLFLLFMPTVYVAGYLWHYFILPGQSAGIGWVPEMLFLEIGGQVAFAVVAWYGLRRSVVVLGVGIILHGVGWDIWHYGRLPYIPDWYAIACLILDVGWGSYVLLRFAEPES